MMIPNFQTKIRGKNSPSSYLGMVALYKGQSITKLAMPNTCYLHYQQKSRLTTL